MKSNAIIKENTAPQKSRMFYIDNLKVFLVMLVIVHHVGQAYGPTGGFWPYKSTLNESIPWLGPFFGVNAGFFMGLFFMISGYFFPASYDRKGGREFLKDKAIRFGIPLLFGVLVLSPAQIYVYNIANGKIAGMSFISYFIQIFILGGGFFEIGFGHLWFVEHILFYALLYCVFRKVFPSFRIKSENRAPGYAFVIILALSIAVVTSIVRIWYPIDKWIGLLWIIQSEVAHLPQYAILFVTGIYAYRKGMFQSIEKKTGYTLLGAGLLMAGGLYIGFIFPESLRNAVFSNWAFYESFMAVFLCWGLIVLFREKFNSSSSFAEFLSQNAYAAYIFHYPIVLFVQYSTDGIRMYGAVGKFLVVSVLSIVITFVTSHLIRRIPLVRRVL